MNLDCSLHLSTHGYNPPLFRHLVTTKRISTFLDFVNEKGLFPDVHPQERFALMTLTPENMARSGTYAFGLEGTGDLTAERLLTLTPANLEALSHGTSRVPVVTDSAIVHLLIAISENCNATYLSANSGVDSYIMVDGGKVSDAPGYCTRDNFFPDSEDRQVGRNGDGQEVVPVYEGKLFGNLDHRLRTFRGIDAKARYGKTPKTRFVSSEEKRNPHYTLEPRYWISRSFVREKLQYRNWTKSWLVLYGRKNNRNNHRTFSTAVVPVGASSDVAPIVLSRSEVDDCRSVVIAMAVGQSFIFDFLVRMRLVGFSIGKNLWREIPVPARTCYAEQGRWAGRRTTFEWIRTRVLELAYTAWDLDRFAKDCGWDGPPFRWDEDRRFLLRSELDAAYFHLYLRAEEGGEWRPARRSDGCPHNESPEQLSELKRRFPTPRDAVAYILDTFPIVRRKDEQRHGEYRTKRNILDIYDAMQASIASGEPYRTRLTPPPADPSRCHPPRSTAPVPLPLTDTRGLP